MLSRWLASRLDGRPSLDISKPDAARAVLSGGRSMQLATGWGHAARTPEGAMCSGWAGHKDTSLWAQPW